jgi:hypothetical protein
MFRGEYREFGEMSPDVPLVPSIPVSTNPENPPGVQPSTTKAKNSGEMANFVVSDAITARTGPRLWNLEVAKIEA